MESIYSECIFKKCIILNSNNLNKNVDEQLYQKLKDLCENKCNNEGFIKKDSIEILKRYNAFIKPNIDLSNVCFTILFKCNVCNPKPNLTFECKVIEIIKPGIICELFPLSIILPEQLHFNKNLYNSIKINDMIKIKILNSKFHINELEIQCVGILLEDKEKKIIKLKNDNKDILNNDNSNKSLNENNLLNDDESLDDESLDDDSLEEDSLEEDSLEEDEEDSLEEDEDEEDEDEDEDEEDEEDEEDKEDKENEDNISNIDDNLSELTDLDNEEISKDNIIK